MATEQLDEAKEAVEEGGEKLTGNGSNGDLKRLLIPAAAGIGTLAATYAARKAPDLMREHVMPKLEDKGADEAQKIGQKAAQGMQSQGGIMGKVAGKAAEKLTGGGKGGGKGKTRRLPIQRWTDVAVPVETAYEKWTEFEEFPKFMHRVLSVQEEDDGKIRWEEKIWFSKRQWQGVITDQQKNDRIAWKTEQGTSHEGIVSFHKLDDKLTRVLVTVDFQPSGIMEKMASGLRFVKRAVQADLARFKAYVEFDEAEGLEYSQESETKKDDSKDKDKDKQKDEDSGSNGNSGSRSSSRSNGSNGDSDSSESQEEQEQARQERAERRQQRRS
jgi:uncharacterized membrane protein